MGAWSNKVKVDVTGGAKPPGKSKSDLVKLGAVVGGLVILSSVAKKKSGGR